METLPDDLIYIQPRHYLEKGGFILGEWFQRRRDAWMVGKEEPVLEITDGMTPDEVRRRLGKSQLRL